VIYTVMVLTVHLLVIIKNLKIEKIKKIIQNKNGTILISTIMCHGFVVTFF